jgi:RNA-binding protein
VVKASNHSGGRGTRSASSAASNLRGARKRGNARGGARTFARTPGRGVARARTQTERPNRTRTFEAPEREPAAELVAPELTSQRKKQLRAEAHALEPLVHVGHAGVSPAVVAAVSRALRDHELIKVRLHEPEDKRGMAQTLANATHAALCGLIGHTVILFKPKPAPRRRAVEQ